MKFPVFLSVMEGGKTGRVEGKGIMMSNVEKAKAQSVALTSHTGTLDFAFIFLALVFHTHWHFTSQYTTLRQRVQRQSAPGFEQLPHRVCTGSGTTAGAVVSKKKWWRGIGVRK